MPPLTENLILKSVFFRGCTACEKYQCPFRQEIRLQTTLVFLSQTYFLHACTHVYVCLCACVYLVCMCVPVYWLFQSSQPTIPENACAPSK